ncbi:MAG: hypothetical protein DMG65_11000 [Candidatus Angelobacter sp. Gp1-AA117]|nr:MAG: hypothetical protein DMG65_11000 [Candidatus Angelobacter sp. Gp1-AA117]
MRQLILLLVCLPALSQVTAPEDDYADLLRRCAQHETSSLSAGQHFQFMERTEQSWGSETRVVIETDEGRADRIVAYNDLLLGPEEQRKQQHRLEKFLRDSDAKKDELNDQREEIVRRINMARVLPDAVLLQFSGKEENGQLRFSFSPNPRFDPPTREAQVYKGMRGMLWIDPASERIVRVQGDLFKDVNFGWGILGRLSKGGHYELAQAEASPGVWRITTMNLNFHGRMLLLRTFSIMRKESSSRFAPAPPDITYAQAVRKLLAEYE